MADQQPQRLSGSERQVLRAVLGTVESCQSPSRMAGRCIQRLLNPRRRLLWRFLRLFLWRLLLLLLMRLLRWLLLWRRLVVLLLLLLLVWLLVRLLGLPQLLRLSWKLNLLQLLLRRPWAMLLHLLWLLLHLGCLLRLSMFLVLELQALMLLLVPLLLQEILERLAQLCCKGMVQVVHGCDPRV